MKWQWCAPFYEKLNTSTIDSVQILMGVYVYDSESLHIGVQEVFKELDNDQNMTVAEVWKKLYTMTQVQEAKDHLQKVNGGKKKMSWFWVWTQCRQLEREFATSLTVGSLSLLHRRRFILATIVTRVVSTEMTV